LVSLGGSRWRPRVALSRNLLPQHLALGCITARASACGLDPARHLTPACTQTGEGGAHQTVEKPESKWYHAAFIVVGEIIGSGVMGLPKVCRCPPEPA
jgi:hypothetical protein